MGRGSAPPPELIIRHAWLYVCFIHTFMHKNRNWACSHVQCSCAGVYTGTKLASTAKIILAMYTDINSIK